MLSENDLEQKHDINSSKSRLFVNFMKRNNECEFYPQNVILQNALKKEFIKSNFTACFLINANILCVCRFNQRKI